MLDWRVPGYRTVRELRAGGAAGRSVLAVHEASGLPVAVRYHASSDGDSGTDRFDALRAEARALADLTSPYVAALYEHVEVVLDGRFGVATVREYVDGASVRLLTRATKLPPAPALGLLRTGLLALAAVHTRGVTHRGYKPENLLVDADGTARVADFAATPAVSSPQSNGSVTMVPAGQVEEDVRAAFRVFVECVTGDRMGKLPRKLRGLADSAAAGDGAALLAAVEKAGRDGWGAQWQARAERELAPLVARAGSRER